MQTVTESILTVTNNQDITSDDFTVSGNFGVVVKSGVVLLEMKVGEDYFVVTEPTDQYYRALKMTGTSGVEGDNSPGSINMFEAPGDETVYRLRALTVGTQAQVVTFTGGGTVTWVN